MKIFEIFLKYDMNQVFKSSIIKRWIKIFHLKYCGTIYLRIYVKNQRQIATNRPFPCKTGRFLEKRLNILEFLDFHILSTQRPKDHSQSILAVSPKHRIFPLEFQPNKMP